MCDYIISVSDNTPVDADGEKFPLIRNVALDTKTSMPFYHAVFIGYFFSWSAFTAAPSYQDLQQ